jgi:hypothetical protein
MITKTIIATVLTFSEIIKYCQILTHVWSATLACELPLERCCIMHVLLIEFFIAAKLCESDKVATNK